MSYQELSRATDKELRKVYKAARRVMERRDNPPPRELAARAQTNSWLSELREQRWEVERQARARAIAEWEAAHPPELPRLPWWPRWRRQLVAGMRDRLLWEYEQNPDRQRFIAEAVQAAAERFYVAYREEHGEDFLQLLQDAYAADSVSMAPARKRGQERSEAWLRIQDVVHLLYDRHDKDIGWIADFLDTDKAKIRSCLGLPEPPRRTYGRDGHGGGDGGSWGGDAGGGCGGGGGGGGE